MGILPKSNFVQKVALLCRVPTQTPGDTCTCSSGTLLFVETSHKCRDESRRDIRIWLRRSPRRLAYLSRWNQWNVAGDVTQVRKIIVIFIVRALGTPHCWCYMCHHETTTTMWANRLSQYLRCRDGVAIKSTRRFRHPKVGEDEHATEHNSFLLNYPALLSC